MNQAAKKLSECGRWQMIRCCSVCHHRDKRSVRGVCFHNGPAGWLCLVDSS